MCDIDIINVRFYFLEVPYSHEYYRIILKKCIVGYSLRDRIIPAEVLK